MDIELLINNMGKIQTENVFVLHVKHGYEDREEFMERELSRFGIDFEYILDGDIPDITNEIFNKYFDKAYFQRINAEVSCALKHILAYEKIVSEGYAGALILEDDIFLDDNFVGIFNNCMAELDSRADIDKNNVLISFEDTRMRWVPRSKRVKGIHLYLGDKDRMAGAYYITFGTAKRILELITLNKLSLPIDGFHEYLLKNNQLDYYWCQPTIAWQGSHNGKFLSGISVKNKTAFSQLLWKLKYFYKKNILYNLR